MNLCILGRQAKLGLAELEQRFGADLVQPVGDGFALVDAQVDIDSLGGTVKVAQLLSELDTMQPQKVFDYCRRELPKHAKMRPEGKIQLGVSLYGFDMPVAKINANVLSLKKAIKQAGRSVRAVPNSNAELSSAQTYHNHLTGPMGMELVFVRAGNKILLAQVTGVQNIDALAARDQARPKTDAFVGMLPPKLALMMVNMSGAKRGTLLDPFCGTGVVLQEAALRGFNVYGTDLSEKMVDYSTSNLKWLTEKLNLKTDVRIHHGDAIETKWHQPIDAVVAETYLGQPFSAPPAPDKLAQVRRNCNDIISKFLQNLAPQIEKGTRLCLAVPAWRDANGRITHLPLISKLKSLGYTQIDLTHVKSSELLYYREDQVVARELLVLRRG